MPEKMRTVGRLSRNWRSVDLGRGRHPEVLDARVLAGGSRRAPARLAGAGAPRRGPRPARRAAAARLRGRGPVAQRRAGEGVAWTRVPAPGGRLRRVVP